ncbi:MAG: peptidylprolyl isomerase [bacterium]|nr:peptidylprolyl isomerase [bacterium]MDT8367286.1 peptidylprolyl isomerase [bacterium]
MQTKSRLYLRFLPARYLATITTILLTVLVTGTCWPADPGEPVAHVNGVTIFELDLSCAIEAALVRNLISQRGDIENPGFDKDQVDNEIALQRLVDIELLYQESLKHRFHGLTEESVQRYQQEVKRLGGEDKLMSVLQCNNMSPEEFRKTIFRRLSIKRLLDKEVYSRIHVTEDAIREYYELNRDKFQKPESVRTRQIVIRVSSGAGIDEWREAEGRAYAIYRDASTGTDFIRLVRRHSEDPASASVGGDMGPIQKGDIQGVLDTRIFTLKEGTVTEPVRSRNGFHIIKIVSTTPSTTKSIEEMKPHIITRIRRERAREMISQLVSDLRQQAEIEIIKSSSQEPGAGSQ